MTRDAVKKPVSMTQYFSKFSKDYASIVAIIVMGIIFSVVSPYFLSGTNIKNILLQSSAIAIVAMGQAFIIMTGQFDLSMGQNVCLTSAVCAYLMKFMDVDPALAIPLALLLGAFIGLCNGLLFSYVGIPAFIATLGLQNICRGLAKIVTNATPISRLPKSIAFFGSGTLGPIPICVLIMLLVYIIGQFISVKTKFGRYIYAIGGGPEAAFFAGINTRKYYCFAFILGGILAAFGGTILMSRLDSVSITNGNLYEFDAVIACVIGGISLTGGKGKIIGGLFGTIFLVMFFNGMSMMNVDPFYQDVIKGLVLVIAIAVDVLRNKVRS